MLVNDNIQNLEYKILTLLNIVIKLVDVECNERGDATALKKNIKTDIVNLIKNIKLNEEMKLNFNIPSFNIIETSSNQAYLRATYVENMISVLTFTSSKELRRNIRVHVKDKLIDLTITLRTVNDENMFISEKIAKLSGVLSNTLFIKEFFTNEVLLRKIGKTSQVNAILSALHELYIITLNWRTALMNKQALTPLPIINENTINNV